MKSSQIKRLVYGAVCIALALVLPLFLGQVRVLEQGISPMHIPALLCGLLCGPVYGAVVGFISPILRSVIFGMPPMYPTALAMAFEMCAYGVLAGLFYKLFKKMNFWPRTYLALIIAMILGRFVGGAAQAILLGIKGGSYSLQAFATAYFVKTSVGAVIHLIVIPVILFALKQAHLTIED